MYAHAVPMLSQALLLRNKKYSGLCLERPSH